MLLVHAAQGRVRRGVAGAVLLVGLFAGVGGWGAVSAAVASPAPGDWPAAGIVCPAKPPVVTGPTVTPDVVELRELRREAVDTCEVVRAALYTQDERLAQLAPLEAAVAALRERLAPSDADNLLVTAKASDGLLNDLVDDDSAPGKVNLASLRDRLWQLRMDGDAPAPLVRLADVDGTNVGNVVECADCQQLVSGPSGDDEDPVRVQLASADPTNSQIETAANSTLSTLWFLIGVVASLVAARALVRQVMPR